MRRQPWEILEGDAIANLRGLPERSFHVAITSPPYWRLRSYLPKGHPLKALEMGAEDRPDCFGWATGRRCGVCYVCRMTDVFAAVKRVLRDDATLWVNVAGSYAQSTTRHRRSPGTGWTDGGTGQAADGLVDNRLSSVVGGWKQKDFVNVPALLAESLRCDGWYLRAEIALTKVAPMPESCRDRPTRATEKLYLFAKRPRYFYDQQAEAPLAVCGGETRVIGPATLSARQATGNDVAQSGNGKVGSAMEIGASRNLWDYWGESPGESDDDLPPAVWPWRPEPSKARGHYAAYPLWLPLRCVRLGTSAKGVCGACGSPWRRVVERTKGDTEASARPRSSAGIGNSGPTSTLSLGGDGSKEWAERGSKVATLGWQQTCKCPPADPVPARVLDCFAGTGTSGVAARLLGRHFTGVELSPEYCTSARERLAGCNPIDDAAWRPAAPPAPEQGTLFDQRKEAFRGAKEALEQ